MAGTTTEATGKGIEITRRFSREDCHPFEEVTWDSRTAEIKGDAGQSIFTQTNLEIPSSWSDLATRIVASKYFYGDQDNGNDPLKGGREHSVRQLVGRVCRTISGWGREDGYFRDESSARAFEEDLTWLCLNQYGAFNSPVWFNCGLHAEYRIGENGGEGNFRWVEEQGRAVRATSQYEYPQCSACFIQSVDDDMDSIMELARAEAMLFKYGSGTGSDLSPIRSTREKLSGGGKPSGPLSFLKVYDQVASVIKSGGKTRRAAKMNVLKDVHPDIEEFITAKTREEKKAWALIEEGYDPSFNGEAYASVMFQNENLSIRASDEFMKAAENGEDWWTYRVVDGKPCEKKSASRLLDLIAEGTHVCGDPGMQFHDTINRWHTCAGTDLQHCTNPCSEYLFLNDTACNLASLNLMKFRTEEGFDFERFAAAARVFIIAQEILVDRSSYPTERIAVNSHWFRTLGLGYANLGALLMSYGYGYDSEEGRGLAAGITAVMTGIAYRASAEMASEMGPFKGFHDARTPFIEKPREASNRGSMLKVMQQHLEFARELPETCPADLREFAVQAWEDALSSGEEHGYRNAQVTVLAPTGTIGFLMDCDTTGIEPAVALVTYKTLAGGGYLTLVIKTVEKALRKLGYGNEAIRRVLSHIEDYGTVETVQVGGKTISSGLKEEHFPVFDCAFQSGMGKRHLSYQAHLKMMAAVQPFLSGAISKTVNMPNEATVADIRNTYLEAWKMGIKAVAIYRDGSKRSAPLKTKKDDPKEDSKITGGAQLVLEPYRRRLPDTRESLTHKFSIGGSEGYLTIGKFEDGQPGEVFIQMSKAGSTINGLMDTIATLVSLCLQYGVPLDALTKKFSHTRFEPEGMTRNPHIPMAKSVVDYIFRYLAMEFIPGFKDANSPQAKMERETATLEEPDEDNPFPDDENQLELDITFRDGLTCPECGSSNIKITGSCAACLNCGSSLGCS